MKVTIYDKFASPSKGLIFSLNLNDNNFQIVNDRYELVGEKIEVDGKFYLIKEVEKLNTAAPIEWSQDKPISIVVEEISTL